MLAEKRQPPATFTQFNKFFVDIDVNGDGFVSKSETARFVRKFFGIDMTESDRLAEIVNKIWFKYDFDRSGYLNRMESLKFLNDFLSSKD